MNLQVGKMTAVAGKLEGVFPTFQLGIFLTRWRFDACLKLETFPTWFPTFQLLLCCGQPGFCQMESWKNLPSYGAVCPGLMPGTSAGTSPQIPNNNHKEEGAWAD